MLPQMGNLGVWFNLCQYSELLLLKCFHMCGKATCLSIVAGREHGGGRGPGECVLGPQFHKGGRVREVRGVHRSRPSCQVRLC